MATNRERGLAYIREHYKGETKTSSPAWLREDLVAEMVGELLALLGQAAELSRMGGYDDGGALAEDIAKWAGRENGCPKCGLEIVRVESMSDARGPSQTVTVVHADGTCRVERGALRR